VRVETLSRFENGQTRANEHSRKARVAIDEARKIGEGLAISDITLLEIANTFIMVLS
jgi:hypothetical protein